MKVNKTVQYYELTNYPDIYNKCYWGHFPLRPDSNIKNQIVNRDLFITEYNIKGYNSKPPRYVQDECNRNFSVGHQRPFDHVEFYKNKNNEHVVITSPYGVEDCEKHEYLIENGWLEIMPMYTPSARTFMKVFKPKRRN